MKGLTQKQRDMLDFIEKFSSREGMSPTVYEIADYFKIKTSTVFAHIKALSKKGFLSRSSKARSITLAARKKSAFNQPSVIAIPLLGRISAGLVDLVQLKEKDIYLDSAVFNCKGSEKIFALKVHGDSMKELGVLNGDIAIVLQNSNVKNGDIVAALIDGETTIKSFHRIDDMIELRPANPEYQSKLYPVQNLIVHGKVIGIMRQYNHE